MDYVNFVFVFKFQVSVFENDYECIFQSFVDQFSFLMFQYMLLFVEIFYEVLKVMIGFLLNLFCVKLYIGEYMRIVMVQEYDFGVNLKSYLFRYVLDVYVSLLRMFNIVKFVYFVVFMMSF